VPVQINQVKDLVERVGWTFIQAEIALGALDWLASGINLSTLHTFYVSLGAALAATIKVLIAQRVGQHRDGAAIPGGVIETPPLASPPPPSQAEATVSPPAAGG
jgi:hypothetical protein